MSSSEREFHEGEFFAWQIARTGLSQLQFARKSGVSRQALTKWFGQKRLRVRRDLAWKIAIALGYKDVEGWEGHRRFGRRKRETGEPSDIPLIPPPLYFERAMEVARSADGGLDLSSVRKAKKVPLFASGVGATPRRDLLTQLSDDSTVVGDGDLVIVIKGDCMQPHFNDGDQVIFSEQAWKKESLIPGKSYCVVFEDGHATFKRVFNHRSDPDKLTLRCYNAKYPNTDVEKADIVRMMRAVRKLVDMDI